MLPLPQGVAGSTGLFFSFSHNQSNAPNYSRCKENVKIQRAQTLQKIFFEICWGFVFCFVLFCFVLFCFVLFCWTIKIKSKTKNKIIESSVGFLWPLPLSCPRSSASLQLGNCQIRCEIDNRIPRRRGCGQTWWRNLENISEWFEGQWQANSMIDLFK